MKRVLMIVDEDGEVVEQKELKDYYRRYGSIVNISSACKELRLSGAEWAVLICIAMDIDYDTNCSKTSVQGISEQTNMPYRSAWRAVAELQKKRIIKKRVIGDKNVFAVNPRYIMRGKQVLKSTLEGFDDEEG